MAKKKQRYAGDNNALTSSPFSGLAKLKGLPSSPKTSEAQAEASTSESSTASAPTAKTTAKAGTAHGNAPAKTKKKSVKAYKIGKTRKGNWPIRLEKRRSGKVVTIIDNITGDEKALLTKLKSRFGTGGAWEKGRVEVQGDHRSALEALLPTLLG